MKPISDNNDIMLGCDPEIFLSRGGKVIGSEKLIPKEGINTGWGKVVIDGIQAELNPLPSLCRQSLSGQLRACFDNLYITAKSQGAVPNFSTTVHVSKDEMDSLSEESKKLGCSPSLNLDGQLSGKISAKAADSSVRSAGGHIHLGKYGSNLAAKALDMPDKVVPMLDRILGNTCVLIDRDPANKKRREVYGRAGEFRKPKHGLEYRTLSNFWLQHYTLFSMVFSLARDAVHVVAADLDGKEGYVDRILNAVLKEDIDRAINENRYMLAYQNFNKIAPIMSEIVWKDGISVFAPRRINEFKYFLRKGADQWFKTDPIDYWAKGGMNSGTQNGIESYLDGYVHIQMNKPLQKLATTIAGYGKPRF